jgi:aminopeptidase N
MLRAKLGDDYFWAGLHHYLEVNRGQNVVTADLQKAIEQQTNINVDQFFHQWIWRAGAPKYEVSYAYDPAAKQIKLDVKQTQKVEGMVGLFDLPVDVEVTTASGHKITSIDVSQAEQSFTIPADSAPLMVLFDKGDMILKSMEFKKEPVQYVYQLKNASDVPDRADAAVALGLAKDYPDGIAALANAASHDPFWGVRVQSLHSLGKAGGPAAEKAILTAVDGNPEPWVRSVAVEELGEFKDDSSLGPKLTDLAANDKAYSVRAAALTALGEVRASNAYDVLTAAVKGNSPDDTLRNAALEGLGELGDDRAVPLLLEWSAPGKSIDTRSAAIGAVAGLDLKNKTITQTLISYLKEPYIDIKFTTVFALSRRGDPDAIQPLEDLVKSGDLGATGSGSFVEAQIRALKAKASGEQPKQPGPPQN